MITIGLSPDQTNALNALAVVPNSWDIACVVAAMTESEAVLRVKEPPTISLVDRDSATRRARRLAVQFDVGELPCVRSREAAQASISLAPHVLWLACTSSFLAQHVSQPIWCA